MDFFVEKLPPAQQLLWPLLKDVPPDFVLYGGTALALRFGHRDSADFDFFSNTFPEKNLEALLASPFAAGRLSSFKKRENIQGQIDLTLKINAPGLRREIDRIVKLTFLTNRMMLPGCLAEPDVSSGNGVKVASLQDLFATKVLAAASRTKTEDFVDIVELIKRGHSLEAAFEGVFSIIQRSEYYEEVSLENTLAKFQSEKALLALKNDREKFDILAEASKNVSLRNVCNSKRPLNPRLFDTQLPAGQAPAPQKKKAPAALSEYKAMHVWNRNEVLMTDTSQFLAFMLRMWPANYYELSEDYGFTDEDFAKALGSAPPGLFRKLVDQDLWEYWHQFFKIEPIPPIPREF